jgi:hypothetical protein
MFDYLERLRNSPKLLQLFSHYAKLSEADPQAWHPRLMAMESDEKVDLSKLHGELIAFDFVDQNTGSLPCCYRLTRAGLKALRQIELSVDDEPGTDGVANEAA